MKGRPVAVRGLHALGRVGPEACRRCEGREGAEGPPSLLLQLLLLRLQVVQRVEVPLQIQENAREEEGREPADVARGGLASSSRLLLLQAVGAVVAGTSAAAAAAAEVAAAAAGSLGPWEEGMTAVDAAAVDARAVGTDAAAGGLLLGVGAAGAGSRDHYPEAEAGTTFSTLALSERELCLWMQVDMVEEGMNVRRNVCRGALGLAGGRQKKAVVGSRASDSRKARQVLHMQHDHAHPRAYGWHTQTQHPPSRQECMYYRGTWSRQIRIHELGHYS